jgi:ribosomal protein S18 acetylase RimI-like enzyme
MSVADAMTIRLAEPPDVEALVQLALAFRDTQRLSRPSEVEFRASLGFLLRDPSIDFLLACGLDGKALGYLQCRYRHSAWVPGLEAEIEDLFIVAASRRRGLGMRLLEFALARAADKGCRLIGLSTNERNEAALALYRRAGFHSERANWNGGRQIWLNRELGEG